MSTAHKTQAQRNELQRYEIRRDGQRIGFVASSQSSTTAPLWSAYGRFGTSPVATGFATRVEAIAVLTAR